MDFFLAFMVMYYSLRDFAIHTGGIRQNEMDRLIQHSEAMRLCRDICNRGKHYAISNPSVDATWSLVRESIVWSDGEYKHFLIAGDENFDPLTIVGRCERFWEDVISDKKIVEPPNPFSPK